MKTIEQALSLLDAFSIDSPELGLSALARLSGFDKAKTRRYLLALMHQGFIEQNEESKTYRLGTAVLKLASIREECFPLRDLVAPVLARLVSSCGETAHFSLLSGDRLHNVEVVEAPRAHRVTMQKGEALPLHATASGLCVLAFAGEELRNACLSSALTRHTEATEVDRKSLETRLDEIRQRGMARSAGTYDDGVTGYGMPVFDRRGRPIGAVAIAAPSSRVTAAWENAVQKKMKEAVDDIQTETAGDFHAGLEEVANAG